MMKTDHPFFNRFGLQQMRFVLASVYFCLLLCSCTPKMFGGLKTAGDSYSSGMLAIFRPVQNESIVYKTRIEYKEKEFSSLVYLNKMSDTLFKVILLSNFGNTLLEAEVSRDRFKLNNVISYLDKKPILELIEQDWRLLLGGNLKRSIPLLFSQNSQDVVYDFVDGRTHNLYHYDPANKSVTMVESHKGRARKVLVKISSNQNSEPEVVSIDHPSLHLKITMSLLKKVSDETIE